VPCRISELFHPAISRCLMDMTASASRPVRYGGNGRTLVVSIMSRRLSASHWPMPNPLDMRLARKQDGPASAAYRVRCIPPCAHTLPHMPNECVGDRRIRAIVRTIASVSYVLVVVRKVPCLVLLL
jgi:hypothetical protein